MNRGEARLSPGSVLSTSTYRQDPGARLVTEVAAADRGRLEASDQVDLGGDLVVDRDPSYAPVAGTRLRVVTSPVRTGTFGRLVAGGPFAGRTFGLDYPTGGVDLVVATAPTAPAAVRDLSTVDGVSTVDLTWTRWPRRPTAPSSWPGPRLPRPPPPGTAACSAAARP